MKRNRYTSIFPKNWDKTRKVKWQNCIKWSKKTKKEFSLSIEQFEKILDCSCNYCGTNKLISIDRIDSSKGYFMENCQSLCAVCNFMKSSYTEEVFFNHIKKVIKHSNL